MSYPSAKVNYSFSTTKKTNIELLKTADIATIKASKLKLADLDQQDSLNRSAISYLAARKADQEQQSIYDYLFTTVVGNELSSTELDYKQRSLLHWAAKCNQDQQIIKQLVNEFGININEASNKFKVTPLYMAVQDNCPMAAAALIAAGADINKTVINGATPLHAAAENSNAEIASLLVAAGANLNTACNNNGTALFVAVQKGNLALVNVLISAGAEVNKAATAQLVTPIFMAVQANHIEMAKALIAAGADLSLKLANDMTAADLAHAMQHQDMAKLLEAN